MAPPTELPENGEIDLTDLDGCPYYARVLQSDLEGLVERFRAKASLPHEFEEFCREENLCAYELSKLLVRPARLITAPYAFFFHPHIRRSLFQWMGCPPDAVDLVIDEAHNLPSHLRELETVSLPQESVRRALSELSERGDFQLPDGPSATRFFEIVSAAVEELVQALVREDDADPPDRRVRGRPADRARRDVAPSRHLAGRPRDLGREPEGREAPRSEAAPVLGRHRRADPPLLAPARGPGVREGRRPPPPAGAGGLLAGRDGRRPPDPRLPPFRPPVRDARPPRRVPGRARSGRGRADPGRAVPLPAGEPEDPLRPHRHHPVRGAEERPAGDPAPFGPPRGDPPVPSGQDRGVLPELRPPAEGPGRGTPVPAPREPVHRVLEGPHLRPLALDRGVEEGPGGNGAPGRRRRPAGRRDRLSRRRAGGGRDGRHPVPAPFREAHGAAGVPRPDHREGLGLHGPRPGPTGDPPSGRTPHPVRERPGDRDHPRPPGDRVRGLPPRPRADRRPREDDATSSTGGGPDGPGPRAPPPAPRDRRRPRRPRTRCRRGLSRPLRRGIGGGFSRCGRLRAEPSNRVLPLNAAPANRAARRAVFGGADAEP